MDQMWNRDLQTFICPFGGTATVMESLHLLRSLRFLFCGSFPVLSVWLSVPTFKKLIENEVLSEFAAISKEAYLVLETLTKRLPNFYSSSHAEEFGFEEEIWCWSRVGPLVDLALDWTLVKDISPISSFLDNLNGENVYSASQVSSLNSLLWVISSVIHTISGVLEAVLPVDNKDCSSSGCLPWLPDFVPKIGLKLIKNGLFVQSVETGDGGDSFLHFLCHLRNKFGLETTLASASCLQGLVQVAVSVDKLIKLAKHEKLNTMSSHYAIISNDEQILTVGLSESSLKDLRALFASIKPNNVQLIETFGRGGPAPGVGVGWGASGGGFWSKTILMAQVDARLITSLVEVFQNSSGEELSTIEHLQHFMQMMNSTLGVCLAAGPRDGLVVDKLFDLLLHIPVLKCLDVVMHQFLCVTEGIKPFDWKYEEEDYQLFSAVLASHFKDRWLSVKTKPKGTEESHHAKIDALKKGNNVLLDTIHEESDSSLCAVSLTQQWAYQRLPLPMQWFLSPISIMHNKKDSRKVDFQQEQVDLVEVAKAGLFFLLGLESTSAFLNAESCSFIRAVPVIWKLHALSVILIDGMAILEDQKSKDVFRTLQNIYGQFFDNLPIADTRGTVKASGLLLFHSEVNENYSTFVEMLVEQFAAESYGDLVFGCQVSVYLRRHVEASVKLATWNALLNVRALELLPPVDSCFGEADGYLEPVEDDEKLLEAYVKSWVSGGLDRAASRRSVSYTLALHHLSSFIFADSTADKLLLRNQLAKSLLRDYTRNVQQRQGMMMNLVQYKKKPGEEGFEVGNRLQVLKDACGGDSSLLKEVEKLKLLLLSEAELTACRRYLGSCIGKLSWSYIDVNVALVGRRKSCEGVGGVDRISLDGGRFIWVHEFVFMK
ncbi:OLC1v1003566C1 [Oldenlandia corymbosa var. corymbosa]|uniref:OLC1v1003566C1 n=1 Tax=Oldenlandia corymbosa var. corymbosa TaxID=529605 RepID=A0AAV1DD31_OLDCO|nr:OLC1v1003566C1 [Oldenlandia corymbosa var. corymbosa]